MPVRISRGLLRVSSSGVGDPMRQESALTFTEEAPFSAKHLEPSCVVVLHQRTVLSLIVEEPRRFCARRSPRPPTRTTFHVRDPYPFVVCFVLTCRRIESSKLLLRMRPKVSAPPRQNACVVTGRFSPHHHDPVVRPIRGTDSLLTLPRGQARCG